MSLESRVRTVSFRNSNKHIFTTNESDSGLKFEGTKPIKWNEYYLWILTHANFKVFE